MLWFEEKRGCRKMGKTGKSMIMFCVLLCVACSGGGSNEKQQEKKEKGEFVYRRSHEKVCSVSSPQPKSSPRYAWEENFVGGYQRITKEFFRCKGSLLHPEKSVFKSVAEKETITDCDGNHSIFILDGKEHIYSVLIDILNYIQKETGGRVVITSGYRCPKHNTYVDPSSYNRTSKHMVGAEVKFFVEGMEDSPKRALELIKKYYKENERYGGAKEYLEFKEYNGSTNVATTPVYNKEVFVKLFKKEEGRSFDNDHSYPYIDLQVRYDPQRRHRVFYSWNAAYHNYYRW
jgi:hypothetical protein